MAIKLTERQKEILDFVKEYSDKIGFPPTIMEVQKHFGFKSPNAVSDHFKALIKKGALLHAPNCARGVKVA